MGVLEELAWRGLLHQQTAEDLGEILERQKITLYTGFDPTAPSLHAGNLVPMCGLRLFQRHGHRVIVVLGGATGLIGDPSGKSDERNLQDLETVRRNTAGIERQLRRFLDEPANPPLVVNNIDWLGPMKLLDFLRDTGKHFSVNAMINKESVKTRFEREGEGISYTEFSYMLLQSRDFLELFRREKCVLQMGGSDQWGNIVSGVDLIRRVEGQRAFGLTYPLLTNSEGRKYGKTEKGAVYLDPALTSPYAFYQFWVNTADADVVPFLKLLTLLPREEIDALAASIGSPQREAQRRLAEIMTDTIHGREETERAIRASAALFSGDVKGLPVSTLAEIFADVPALTVPKTRISAGPISLVDLLVEVGACNSKSDARRQLAQGAVRLNGDPVAPDGEPAIGSRDFLEGEILVIRRGKRNNYLVRLQA
jgi:tyrosyl-tRNA synthetase